MPEPRASVIVRAKNEARGIERTFKSLRRQTVPVEIVVVDSGSTDGTVEIARRWCDRLIEIPAESFTYGYSLNCGAEVAPAPFHFSPLRALRARGRRLGRALAPPLRARGRGRDERDPDLPGRDERSSRSSSRTPTHVRAHLLWGFSNHASSWRAELWREHPFAAGADELRGPRVGDAGHRGRLGDRVRPGALGRPLAPVGRRRALPVPPQAAGDPRPRRVRATAALPGARRARGVVDAVRTSAIRRSSTGSTTAGWRGSWGSTAGLGADSPPRLPEPESETAPRPGRAGGGDPRAHPRPPLQRAQNHARVAAHLHEQEAAAAAGRPSAGASRRRRRRRGCSRRRAAAGRRARATARGRSRIPAWTRSGSPTLSRR